MKSFQIFFIKNQSSEPNGSTGNNEAYFSNAVCNYNLFETTT